MVVKRDVLGAAFGPIASSIGCFGLRFFMGSPRNDGRGFGLSGCRVVGDGGCVVRRWFAQDCRALLAMTHSLLGGLRLGMVLARVYPGPGLRRGKFNRGRDDRGNGFGLRLFGGVFEWLGGITCVTVSVRKSPALL